MYSHLSNKRGAHAYRFWKIPPSTKTLHIYWILRFFHPPQSTPRFLELCTSFFQKIPPSTFIPTSTFNPTSTFIKEMRVVVNSSLINSFIVLWFHFIWLKLNFNFNEHSYLIISFTLDLPWRENYAPLSLFSWSHIQSEEKITSSPYFRNTKNKILHMAANMYIMKKTFSKKYLFLIFFGR